MAWKPDFTKDNPYEGVTEEYVEKVEETFIPTPENPENPVVDWFEEHLEEPPPAFVDIEITPTQAAIYYPVTPPPANVHIVYTPPSQPAIEPTEGVHKPTWLSDLLSNLNWDFMGVHLYVGDAIERGIDWVIAWLNWLLHQADQALAVADLAFREIGDLWGGLQTLFNQAIQSICNQIDTWWSSLEGWWQTKVTWINGLVDSATQGLSALIVAWHNFWTVTWPQWTGELAGLRAEWDNFWTITFPTLFDINYAEQWWTGKATDVAGLIKSAIAPWIPLLESWQDWMDKVAEFFEDPFGWIQTHIIEPIIDDFNKGFDRGMKGE